MGAGQHTEEAKRLLDLARSAPAEGRGALFSGVVDFLEREDAQLAPRERAIISDILRHLVHDVEMSIRRQLADRLAAAESAPRELVVLLANDRIEVAYPVLTASPVLKEPDLLDIVRRRTAQHQLAVALRRDISARLSEALIATGNEDVIVTLLENPDAELTPRALSRLVMESERIDRYRRPLLHRSDLPPDLARRMYAWVSDALRTYIAERFSLARDILDESLRASRDAALSEALARAQPSQRLIDKLHGAGDLGPPFLIKALMRGDVPLFEVAFAKLLGTDVPVTRRILYEASGEGLAVACKAVGIDRSVFNTLFRLTRKARGEPEALTNDQARRIQALFESLSRAGAAQTILSWANHPGAVGNARHH